MMKNIFKFVFFFAAVLCFFPPSLYAAGKTSEATSECIECHSVLHPGIVSDWQRSAHGKMSIDDAAAAPEESRKVSSMYVMEEEKDLLVGCAECHTRNPDSHADTFEHNGYQVHVVVTPADCAACHAKEAMEYSGNIMSHAYKNLAGNPLYQDLQSKIIGKPLFKDGRLGFAPESEDEKATSCYFCHGTRITLEGMEKRDTDFGELEFPVLSGWPNQGSGRINPDNTKGSCTPCHKRHVFSMAEARKPYACKGCHSGPDVPAFKVYMASAHGTLFSSSNGANDFKATPWIPGRDFSTPTCATCHMSLIADTEGNIINQRTHKMSDRLGIRIFGLIYSHPQPLSPDTTLIRNSAGLYLPTDFNGKPAQKYLISAEKVSERRDAMKRTCRACHDQTWTDGHFTRLDKTIASADSAVSTATRMLEKAWEKKLAQGPGSGGSPFDEEIERYWMNLWLFHANQVRFTAAMAGGGDYAVFDGGRYQLSEALIRIHRYLKTNNP